MNTLETEAYQAETLETYQQRLIVEQEFFNGMHVFRGQWWLFVFRPFGGGEGLALGRWVFTRSREPTLETLVHEAMHVIQWRQLGFWGFVWFYFGLP